MEFILLLGVIRLVNKATSIIEINGNRYDAVTGQLIGAVKKAAHHVKKPVMGMSLDGFTRHKPAKLKQHAKRSVLTLQRTPQRSKTLLRNIVKKPVRVRPENKIKARGLSPDYARASRAKNILRDVKVQRFGLLSLSRKVNGSSEAKTGEVIKPNAAQPSYHASATATSSVIMGRASHHRLERLLDYALAHADAHKRELEKSTKKHRKIFSRVPKWLALSLLVLGLAGAIGFVVWHKLPQASLKLAAIKSHVNASLPTPISGYKIGPITASENAVITTVLSVSDNSKKYTVTEQASNQPTASLAASAASASPGSTKQVQTVQDQDKTYVLSQDKNKSVAACTNGTNTITVAGEGLNVAQLLEAAKNACKN